MRTTLYILLLTLLVSCDYNRFEPLEPTPTEPWCVNFAIEDLREETVRDHRTVEGVVVTSDSTGNFYKQMIIADPTTRASLAVELGLYEIYTLYPVGAVVAVRLDGLTSATTADGMLGVSLPSSLAAVTRMVNLQGRNEPLEPIEVKMAALKDMPAGSYVCISSVHFPKAGLATFSGEVKLAQLPYVSAAVSEVTLYTSPYADFAQKILPKGIFDLRAIVLFRDGKPQLRIIDLSELSAKIY